MRDEIFALTPALSDACTYVVCICFIWFDPRGFEFRIPKQCYWYHIFKCSRKWYECKCVVVQCAYIYKPQKAQHLFFLYMYINFLRCAWEIFDSIRFDCGFVMRKMPTIVATHICKTVAALPSPTRKQTFNSFIFSDFYEFRETFKQCHRSQMLERLINISIINMLIIVSIFSQFQPKFTVRVLWIWYIQSVVVHFSLFYFIWAIYYCLALLLLYDVRIVIVVVDLVMITSYLQSNISYLDCFSCLGLFIFIFIFIWSEVYPIQFRLTVCVCNVMECCFHTHFGIVNSIKLST